ncbi:Asp-tRNA(Asn)/Glu-tRNA(Gln) amidotransferase subunit GatA [Paraburkholderia caballeronis]|uniref:Glutamyl-tRNA(Gln) amidotransferase subunit A n=1 Tax=Paraburkholderia caballeronis TaxID=416943 RepID=A0A1H7HH84_9BURK|nr:Asp-tRNA(Asn)/Glu-tRNA(Gln) amidotransferase subunit GatA [Paraburkholderia caballeronis]PXW29552.1 aspartyl/glutamyl-tRNA(Asn/Gln) amidotransferase subunit A [Paraburkholderia caballeronis]PXX04811.1 aspartyl/glutamyl-tRNA(Asn/Gln) amidotransferase subunit A [Paraburkholderia caballeronis]RAK05872.1 aspartyl/glutamyl-tRNA(Asn/Gln) amidotransferase subunit A [Paraburkholderia caballeronis]SEB42621.1 aspartyl/glutamyl-tRNA(Asn/Gln) amidotransferase subunit A [Paraburkholderia caballeronis]SE
MHEKSLTELRAALAAKDCSAVELAQLYLGRIEAHQGLNAFIDVNPELTLAQAKAADARLAAGDAGPLTGLPLAHKDVFVTRGWRSTAGSKMLENYVSPFDATVVERLERAGMVCVGKTNMDEFAMGSSNENSYFGAVRNPWDPKAVPGGSSGGSAAAVAARLAPAATGTDTGGSIRQPASFSGVTGIKPTYGRVSRYGMIAFASSLDQGGPLAQSAADCALLLNAMAGFDTRDSTSLERADEDYTRYLGAPWRAGADADKPLAGLRIGLPKEYFGDGLAADVRAAIDAALRQYEVLGATLVEVSLPKTELSIPVYYVIAPAEASSNLSRFDGVRYGHRAAGYGDLLDMYKKSRAEGFGAEVKRRILVGTYVLSHGYYDAYYLQAQKIRRIIAQDFQQAFEQCDVIMGPVAPSVAWDIGAKGDDPLQMYLADVYTLSTSLAGLPGMSVPCGFGAGANAQRPVGLQIVGNYFNEARMLQVADAFQRATDWHRRAPAEGGEPPRSLRSLPPAGAHASLEAARREA